MKLGLKPVVYEADRIGGRLRSRAVRAVPTASSPSWAGCASRRPRTALLPLRRPARAGDPALPQPADAGHAQHGRSTSRARRTTPSTAGRPAAGLPRGGATPGREALEEGASFADMQDAIRDRDVARIKEIWNTLVADAGTSARFYDFVADSRGLPQRSFRHREIFGQVGFGTGGWDTDFPNSMLEILRVVYTDADERPPLHRRRRRAAAAAAVATRAPSEHGALAGRAPRSPSLHGGAPRPGVTRHRAARAGGRIAVTDRWGDIREFTRPWSSPASPGCCSTRIDCDERAVPAPTMWTAHRPHPLHAVLQDLRHGRPAVLEGHGPGHRPRRHEHDAHRPDDPRHLPVRPRAGPAGRDLPLLHLDRRRAEVAAAAGRASGCGRC